MYQKILIPLLTIVLVACNNSGNDTNATNDSADKKMNQDFKNLKNNETVSSPVKVKMGVDKMKVDTTGPVVSASGHYHIFIDAEDSLASGVIVPKDSTHLHYGKAQTEAEVPLTPGKHKLTLQFADGLHRSYGSRLATTVTVNVKK